MTTQNYFLISSFFFCISIHLSAQDFKVFSEKKLLKDFDQLVAVIEAHPAPYRAISQENLEKLIDSTRTLIDHPMDVVEFYKLASPVIAAIKDGHSSLWMPRNWMKYYKKENGVFPYKIYLQDDLKLYIIENHSGNETIPEGAEILKLNGVPVTTFIKEISPLISYEQEIFRNRRIEDDFDMYLLLYFGKRSEIELTFLSDAVHTQEVKFVDYNFWKNDKSEEEEAKEKLIAQGKPYEYRQVREDVGLLKMHSFSFGYWNKYENFLDKTFRQMKKEQIGSLIIDVRGNTGGYTRTVSDLIHRISDKYFKVEAKAETKVSKAYRNFFQNGSPRFNFYAARFYRSAHSIDMTALFGNKIGTMITNIERNNEAPIEKNYEFSGDLYLLVDGRSYSASSCLAATFRCYRLGLIIGSETGGTRVFHAHNMFETLSNSRLGCGMATARIYTTCYHDENEGIKPDAVVQPTILDLVAKRDAALDYTLRIIDKIAEMERN